MTILELNRTSTMAHLSIDGTEYMVFAITRGVASIIAGRQWIRSRRGLGRTFRHLNDIRTHYRKHGAVLAEVAGELAGATEYVAPEGCAF